MGAPEYSALACAVAEDGGRVLFLKKIAGGREVLELPCVLVEKGMDPVSALKCAVLAQTGIDAQVGGPVVEGGTMPARAKGKNGFPR